MELICKQSASMSGVAREAVDRRERAGWHENIEQLRRELDLTTEDVDFLVDGILEDRGRTGSSARSSVSGP